MPFRSDLAGPTALLLVAVCRDGTIQVFEECGECAAVRRDRGGVNVLARTALVISADTEDDGCDASLAEEACVRGTMLAQNVGSIPLIAGGLLSVILASSRLQWPLYGRQVAAQGSTCGTARGCAGT